MYDVIMVDIWYNVFYKTHGTVKYKVWTIVIQFYKYYLGGQKIPATSADHDIKKKNTVL